MSKKRLTFEYVKGYFEEQGCELIEKKYISSNTKMRYRCICKDINEINFNNFQQGRRCKKCGIKKMSESQKYSFEYVYNYFKDQGCKLIEKEYVNMVTKMNYICNCKNINKITFIDFKSGRRCKKCGIKKLSKSKTFTFEYVYNYFKDQGCKLIEKEYVNSDIKMKYRCNCGKIHRISFVKFKQGQRCNKCAKERRKQTMMKKYGVSYFPHCGYSKESQKLFDATYSLLDKKYKNKTYYATLNREFGTSYKGKSFKYDYVNSKSKKVIEYNGSIFHPIPTLKNSAKNWFVFNKNKTAKEARDYEKIKYEGLEKQGYQILTVWDYELYKNFDNLVQKCLNFLES